jgi:hypothetical protein
MAKSTAVLEPNLGLFLDRSALTVPSQGLLDGYNFRIEFGRINNLNLGWTELVDGLQLNGPVLHMDFFFVNGIDERDIFLTDGDIYNYNPTNDDITLITPIYVTGTAAATGTAVTGTATAWTSTGANGRVNVLIGDEIAFGVDDENDPAAAWYEITAVGGATGLTLANPGVPVPVVDGPYTIRQRFQGDVGDKWYADVFSKAAPSGNDTWYATNGVDNVLKWDGLTDTAEYVDLGFTCKVLRSYSNMMIYGAITQGGDYFPNDIINSNPGEPENVSGGLSEQFTVFPNANQITAMVPIGDNLVVYSRRNVTLAQFVGDPFVFVFRQTVSELGPIAGGLIADLGDFHEFVAPDGQYFFDGVAIKQSAQQIWRSVLQTLDPTRIHTAHIHFNEEHGDLMWIVPLVTDAGVGDSEAAPATAFVEHYLEDVPDTAESPYSRRSCPFLSSSYTEQRGAVTFASTDPTIWADYSFRWNDSFLQLAYPISIFGDADGRIWKINTSQFADGEALPSFVRFGRRATADGRMRALMRRVYPFALQFSNPLTVKVHMSDHAAGPITLTQSDEFDQSLVQGEHFVSPFRAGRFYEIEFAQDDGLPYSLEGYDTDVSSGGMR